jgi:hypothetical protein
MLFLLEGLRQQQPSSKLWIMNVTFDSLDPFPEIDPQVEKTEGN